MDIDTTSIVEQKQAKGMRKIPVCWFVCLDAMAYPHYRSPFGDTTFTKVFVGGLAWETPTEEMHRYFEQFGEILEAVIITDKNTGKSKGYGFVTFRNPESARRACVDPNPVIDGRRANCNIASLGRPRPSPPRGTQLTVLNTGITKLSIIHKFSSHNTIINYMDHHLPQWGLHIIMAILCKLPGEHFLQPKLNASPDRPIFTIQLRWRGPSPPIIPHPFISLGIPFPLPQIQRLHSIPPQKQKLRPSLLKVQKLEGKNSSRQNVQIVQS
ncbi:hypothetical protein REPUB_Repub19eG0080000 [Reevesia pubescens]